MNRNEQFKLEKAKQDEESKKQLEVATKEAHSEGKEPFDLDLMDRLWRDNPDKRFEAQGIPIHLENRIYEWSWKYYVQYPNLRTMSEFVAAMKASQMHGFFD